MFGSSSPSYPIIASIEQAVLHMLGPGLPAYQEAAEAVLALRESIDRDTPFRALRERAGLRLDPARLTVCTAACGISGYGAAEFLEREEAVFFEMADLNNLVAIFTCSDGQDSFDRLRRALARLSARGPGAGPPKAPPTLPEAQRAVSLHSACFARKRLVRLRLAQGLTAGETISLYPPGIPLIAPGEVCTQKHLAYLTDIGYNMDREFYFLQE